MHQKHSQDTSWQKVAKSYHKTVGDSGHYYHQHVVIPKSLALLDLKPGAKLLDLGCGQGVLARSIPPQVDYVGVDAAADLIKFAQKDAKANAKFIAADATKPLANLEKDFSHCAIILALQNMENMGAVANAAAHLIKGGKLLIVLNHPAFRIPRLSSWGIDESNKQQYRKVNAYMTANKIPINMEPGRGSGGKLTWSFHHPLSDYTRELKQQGFVISEIQEWVSDKESVGKAAKMENRSRSEIPLFMAILAEKKA